MAEQEIEFKFELEQSAYLTLTQRLGRPTDERRFANCYYTVPKNTRRDWVLRLRCEDEHKELTLKLGRLVSTGLYESMEYTAMVETRDPDGWLDTEPIRVLRQEISSEPLIYQGESRNHRLLFDAPIEVGRTWEVDHCELPNGEEFYELEVEVQGEEPPDIEELRGRLLHWLDACGIAVKPSTTTKYKRFLASCREP